MKRAIIGVIAGLAAWFVIATVLDVALRTAWSDYATAEAAMKQPEQPAIAFTLPMMIARLVLGAVSSIGAGIVALWAAKANRTAVKVLAILLVVLFIPVHVGLWERFPIWYHLFFLISLAPLTILGGALVAQKGSAPRTA